LENRLHILNVRDDKEQNRKVRDDQLERSKRPSWLKPDYSEQKKVAQRAIEMVDKEAPHDVIVPYANSLKQILSVEDTAVRRNTPKVLELIKASAHLHYRQRPRLIGPKGEVTLIATLEDLWFVLGVGKRGLEQTLATTSEKVSMILGLCRKIGSKGETITTTSILAEARTQPNLGIGAGDLKTVQGAVKALLERGFLSKRFDSDGKIVRNDQRAYVYDLVNTDSSNLVLDTQAILRDADMELSEWLRVGGKDLQFDVPQAMSPWQERQFFGDRGRPSPNLDDSRPTSLNPSPDVNDANSSSSREGENTL
jgi:hypothetical protein